MLRFKVLRKSYVGSVAYTLDIYINKTIKENPDIVDVIAICGSYDKGFEVYYKVKDRDISEGDELDELFVS